MSEMNDRVGSIRQALETSREGLDAVLSALGTDLSDDVLNGALDLIYGMSGRLIVSGVGKSGLVGKKLAATFASTGTPAYFVHALEASHGDLGMIRQDDVLMLLSWSGESRELGDIIAYGQRFRIPIISITGRADSRLARVADFPLVLPKAKEACPHNLAPTTSTLMQMAIGDALAVTLLKMRGFSERSFRDFHPGGKLGAALTPVSDIMYRDDALPMVPESATVFDVVAEISGKGHGITGVRNDSGALVGVVTDGDIRRYLEANSTGSMRVAMWETHAVDIMTRNMITLAPERLCGRALNVMQSKRISAAFIVDGDQPQGLITTLKLLENGVA